jgi:hypothetical protein
MHLANSPDGGARFGAAGLTSWSMTIRTDGAQQVGDPAVAGRMLGGGELGTLHRPHQNCDSILPNSMGRPGEILSLSGYSLAESAIATGPIKTGDGTKHPSCFFVSWTDQGGGKRRDGIEVPRPAKFAECCPGCCPERNL